MLTHKRTSVSIDWLARQNQYPDWSSKNQSGGGWLCLFTSNASLHHCLWVCGPSTLLWSIRTTRRRRSMPVLVLQHAVDITNAFAPLGIELCVYFIRTIASKIIVTPKGVYLPISKLHSILAVANLLAHNNKSQICYCGQIFVSLFECVKYPRHLSIYPLKNIDTNTARLCSFYC